jgi:glucose/arabinose dehydrogenase/PKD repeat protein
MLSMVRMFRRLATAWTRVGAVESPVIAAVLLAAIVVGLGSSSAAPPSQFTDTVAVSGLGDPTDVAVLPSGRLLITTQSGTLWSANGSSKSVVSSAFNLCSNFERGLLGVTIDPQFASNGYIYLYYTYNKYGSCEYNSSSSPVNRVSRFTYNTSSNTIGGETVLVDGMPSPGGNHNAGDLVFGADGYLYISVGDGGCDLSNANLCGGQNTNSRKQNILTGKILRITRDGGIPSGNPFTGSDSGRCNVTGRTSAAKCQETFAWGFRNPFRIAANLETGSIYANDVGQNLWEEVDNVQSGRDYGWNICEGTHLNGSSSACGSGTLPIAEYGHGSCNSITGGAFVPSGIWPESYDGVYLFSDYTCGTIWKLSGGSRTTFSTGAGPISLQFGKSGDTQALFYTTFDNNGQVRKIQYTGQANRPPVANATSDVTYGVLPLTVKFDGTTSTDPDGDSLTYDWDFGDGTAHSANSKPTHIFTTAGKRTVKLTVSDSRGGTDTDTIVIDAGNTPPVVTIQNPTPQFTYSVGQAITLTANATDTQDGTIPDSSLTWNVILHHDTHTHPFLTNQTGNNLVFNAPPPEDLQAATNSFLEIKVRAVDSNGLAKTNSIYIQPKKIDVSFDTFPSGLKLSVEGSEITTPATLTGWTGWTIEIAAPASQPGPGGQNYVFSNWSDAGAAEHDVVLPASDTSFTATYASAQNPTFGSVADARVQESSPGSNYGTATTLAVVGGSASDIESYLRFTVAGLGDSIASAQLWVYVSEGTSNGPALYTAPNTWSEMSITWNNRPARSSSPIEDKGAIGSGTWVVYDVSSVVDTPGTYTFVLVTSSSNGITARSRESSSNQPKLIINAGGGSDTQAPSTPSGLAIAPVSSTELQLSWTAATDNVGVTGYDIYRNGKLLTTIDAGTGYRDSGLSPSTEYGYQIRARDAAGNTSSLSTEAEGRTRNRTLTYSAKADARVQQSNPNSRYGTSNYLQARGSSTGAIESYIRFTISGQTDAIVAATLKLWVPAGSANGSAAGVSVYYATASWTESTITWNNRPARSTVPIVSSAAFGDGVWLFLDVSDLVTANGSYTFVVASGSTDSAIFSSREGAQAPRLQIELDPNADARIASVGEIPEPTATPAPTETATPEPTSTPDATATPDIPAEPSPFPVGQDFESGEGGDWIADSGFAIQNDLVQSGSFAGRAVSNGSGGNPGQPASLTKDLGSSETELYVSLGVNVSSHGDTFTTLLALLDANGMPAAIVAVTPDGRLGIVNGAGDRLAVIEPLDLERWYELQVHIRLAGGERFAELWLDGQLIFQKSEPVSVSSMQFVRIGDPSTTATFDVAFDNLAIDRQCIGNCSSDLREPTVTAPETPEAGETPAPTAQPEETATVEPPTETPEPTEEPATETPEPTATEEPTEEPSPTEPPTEALVSETES